LLGLFLIGSVAGVNAHIKQKPEKGKKDQTQREAEGIYDQQQNTVSAIQFETTNYGIFGFNVRRGEGGGYWPRGSRNQYIFGGGVWFGAQKERPGEEGVYKKYVELSYNPWNGRSWFVPGRIEDGDLVNEQELTKYRVYFSTDFSSDGKPINPDDGENWPIWDASDREIDTLMHDRYFGYYIEKANRRDVDNYPKGPAFISGEDIFSTYKDTDLGRFDGGAALRKSEGYPLRLQVEQTIYSWGFGDYADFIFIKYDYINYSKDTLLNCWMAPVMDVDIALAPNTQYGAGNDRTRFCFCDPSLNLAYQWTEGDRGEEGNGFGYLGFDFLESPAVVQPEYDNDGNIINKDEVDFVRNDKRVFTNEEQLGLVTVRNWNIDQDKQEDETRYNFISSGIRDDDLGSGDKRFMMATGPFHMRPAVNDIPQDTVRVVVGLILANTAVHDNADGSCEDAAELIRKDKFAQEVYDKNFQAPRPPWAGRFTSWKPMSHGVQVSFDSTSELSLDRFERGMEFLGYALYRARRIDLDTFDVDNVTPNLEYTKGKGPFGWKQVARWEMQTPFRKSSYRAGKDEDNMMMPMIDSLRLVGLDVDKNGNIQDSMALKIMRVPRGVVLHRDDYIENELPSIPYYPVVAAVDTGVVADPWGKWYSDNYNNSDLYCLFDVTPFGESVLLQNMEQRHKDFIDSVMLGTLYFNRALMKYNPLFFKPKTVKITQREYDSLPDNGIVYLQTGVDPDGNPIVDSSHVDTVFYMDTFREVDMGGGEKINAIDALVKFKTTLSGKDYVNKIMQDKDWVRAIEDSIYQYIKHGKVQTIEWPTYGPDNLQFEETHRVQRQVIVPYMREITDGRDFVDIGDDNFNGIIDYSDDPTESERLVNNVDYYYKLLAFDEGDYLQPTPRKFNNASSVSNPNIVMTYPQAAPIGNRPTYEVTHVDSNKIGGLYDFEFYSINPQRVMQNFAGHELELKFEPYWNQYMLALTDFPEGSAKLFGLYQRMMTLTDLTTGELLYRGLANFETSPCDFGWRGLFTEDAFSYVFSADPIIDSTSYDPATGEFTKINTFGTQFNNEIIQRSGLFTTGDFRDKNYCYARNMLPPAYGSLGFEFKFSMQQFGGMYRPDSTTLQDWKYDVAGNPSTVVDFIQGFAEYAKEEDRSFDRLDKVFTTQWESTSIAGIAAMDSSGQPLIYPQNQYGSFNNGPGHYLVEFQPGGKDTLDVWIKENGGTHKQFICDYLTMKVKNAITYKRPSESGDSVIVNYPDEYHHVVCGWDTTRDANGNLTGRREGYATTRPSPRNLPLYDKDYNDFIGGYNLHAVAWVNARNIESNFKLKELYAHKLQEYIDEEPQSVGDEGRYYLSATNAQGDQIDFSHILNIAGVQFALDYANKGRLSAAQAKWATKDNYEYGEDFKAGDKIMLKVWGGALGMPMPGATVRVKIGEAAPQDEKYTDELMDKIQIVPNPYIVSHQDQKSPYDAKIFFTRLPAECTIDIYTPYGSLVKTIEHNEYNSAGEDTRHAVAVWDLLSSNNQRVSSQSLVAVITSPDGSQTVKNFSVVVGGFRLVPED
jgi:hypothetical protein